MNKNRVRVAVIAAAGMVAFAPVGSAMASTVTDGVSIGGLSYLLEQYYSDENASDSETTSLLASDIEVPANIAMANVNEFCYIREGAGTSYNIVGILIKDAYCIVKSHEDGWAQIESGSVKGYIKDDYLFMYEEGVAKAKETAELTATVTATTVNVRSNPSTTENNIIAEVTKGEQLEVIDETSKELFTKDDPGAKTWVKVAIDDVEGYVTREYVNVAYTWKTAVKQSAVTSSILRNTIVNESMKYIGLKYVWGGQSLVTGADCSGFVRAIYKKCGVDISKLNRTSYDMAAQSYGKTVSLKNAKPGDLVFYGDSRGNINHVAIYIGNGQIIHESGRKSGCKISNVNYRTIVKIKNFLD